MDSISFSDITIVSCGTLSLELNHWMGIPIQGYPVTLDRFKSLLLGQSKRLGGLPHDEKGSQ
jgi:hypothetical protein